MSTRHRIGSSLRWLVLLVVLAAPFVAPNAAQAHALLQQSTPADGATYDRSPGSLELVFTEDVQVAASTVELFDGAGRRVALGVPASDDGAANSPILRVPLGPLAKDRYLVRWRTISSDDLHPTAGSIVFGIGTGVTAAGQDEGPAWANADSIAESVIRWIALMAIGFALASCVLSRRLLVMNTEDAETPVLPRATVMAAGIGAVASVALAVLYLARIADVGGWLPIATAWQFTLRWVVAVAAAVAGWILLRRSRSISAIGWAAPTLLVLALAAITSTSHPTSSGILLAAVGALHTVTTMLWACGAAVVAAVAVPSLRSGDRLRAVAMARAFTPVAVVMVPVSVVTGLLLAGRLLPSVGALLNTDYGHALLLKLGLLTVGLLCAGATVCFLVLGGGRRRTALVVGVEAVVLGGVVLAASTLAATHPASPVVWAPAPDQAATSGVLSALASDLVITADVGPGRPGRNFVTIGVLDTRRPAPAPVSRVTMAMASEAPLAAVPQGDHLWVAIADIQKEGPAPFEITVQRVGEPTVRVPFTWTFGPAPGTRLGGSELSPLTGVAALCVALAALVVLVLYFVPGIRARRTSGRYARRAATSANAGWESATDAASSAASALGSSPNP